MPMRISKVLLALLALPIDAWQAPLRRPHALRRPQALRPRTTLPASPEDEFYDAQEEYETAAARLRAAERRLAAAADSAPKPRPIGAKSLVDRSDAGTLLLTVPASGLTTSTLFGLAFSAAWFSAIVPATAAFVAARAVASAAFMAPFWLAGGTVVKSTLLDPAKTTTLSVGEYAWELTQSVAGVVDVSEETGPTEDLAGADVAVTIVQNGVPSYACRLVSANGVWGVGDGLPREELEWIASEINDQLASYASRREEAGGEMPRPLPPK